ncbi:MAG: hypothetical protein ACK4J0_00080 [Candidatus Anstonellaceae archaeon]
MNRNILKQKLGQITIESLLIFLISLSVIMIAFATVSVLDKTQRKVAYGSILNMQADQIEEFVNQACILGDGNYYTLKLANINLKISQQDKKTLKIQTGTSSLSRTFLCDIELTNNGEYKGKAFVWYENGVVYFSDRPKQ